MHTVSYANVIMAGGEGGGGRRNMNAYHKEHICEDSECNYLLVIQMTFA